MIENNNIVLQHFISSSVNGILFCNRCCVMCRFSSSQLSNQCVQMLLCIHSIGSYKGAERNSCSAEVRIRTILSVVTYRHTHNVQRIYSWLPAFLLQILCNWLSIHVNFEKLKLLWHVIIGLYYLEHFVTLTHLKTAIQMCSLSEIQFQIILFVRKVLYTFSYWPLRSNYTLVCGGLVLMFPSYYLTTQANIGCGNIISFFLLNKTHVWNEKTF